MKFLIPFLLMFQLKESKLCPVDKSKRKLFKRNKVHVAGSNVFYNAVRELTSSPLHVFLQQA